MYILMVTRGYPTKQLRTLGIFEFDQARALVEAGCKVVYIAMDARSILRWRKWGISKKKIDGVDLYICNLPIGPSPLEDLKARIKIWGIRRLYKEILKDHGRPDLIHGHFINFNYYSSFLKEDTGLPLVTTEHSSTLNKKNISKRHREIGRLAYSKSDKVITVGDSLARMLNYNFGVSPTIVPNMVDTDIFNYRETEKKGKFRIISVGNLIETKRMDLSIQAFYQAFKDKDNVEFLIYGRGKKKKDLQKLIEEYGMEDRIFLKGIRPREEIAKAYRKADLFVLPSQSETFGVAYIEALASGIPVIATRCGGPTMFVNDSNGILIDVDDLEGLRKAMIYMYKNIDQYQGEEISQDIKSKYAPEVVAEILIDNYKEVLQDSI